MDNKLMPQITLMFYLLLFSALMMVFFLSPNLAARQISQPQFFQRSLVHVPIALDIAKYKSGEHGNN